MKGKFYSTAVPVPLGPGYSKGDPMASDVQSLHCPNCGAVADPHAARCPYCRARLATVSCPRCFATMFETSAFCPKCGARADRVDAGPASAGCPACKGPLERVALGEAFLLECRNCDGVWLDAAEFERVCADREAQAAVVHRWSAVAPVAVRAPSRLRASSEVASAGQVRYRPCVRCGKMMNRVNFSRMSGTIVDVCRGHGTFLDAGELHAIVTFIQQGGVARAREREIDDLREERRRLREAQAAQLRRHAADTPASTGWDTTALGEVMKAILD